MFPRGPLKECHLKVLESLAQWYHQLQSGVSFLSRAATESSNETMPLK